MNKAVEDLVRRFVHVTTGAGISIAQDEPGATILEKAILGVVRKLTSCGNNWVDQHTIPAGPFGAVEGQIGFAD